MAVIKTINFIGKGSSSGLDLSYATGDGVAIEPLELPGRHRSRIRRCARVRFRHSGERRRVLFLHTERGERVRNADRASQLQHPVEYRLRGPLRQTEPCCK